MNKRKTTKYKDCHPKDVATKSFFLGPQSENAYWTEIQLTNIVRHYFKWRKQTFPDDGSAISLMDQQSKLFQSYQGRMEKNLLLLNQRLEKETPTHTPRYIGHMVSEVSLPAILGHISILLHNPNNISKEVARVGLKIEKEAIAELLKMVGYSHGGRGHFTSGGTVANFEALLRARHLHDQSLAMGLWLKNNQKSNEDFFSLCQMGWKSLKKKIKQYPQSYFEKNSAMKTNPYIVSAEIKKVFNIDYQGPVILVPTSKHYSWKKAISLMNLGYESFWPIEIDQQGRLDILDLVKKIELCRKGNRPILMIVSVAGTTELGEIDPIDKVQKIIDEYKKQGIYIWHHVDAAYGGFYCSLLRGKKEKIKPLLALSQIKSFEAIKKTNSLTIDPHKLGYVPYACGAILTADEDCYQTFSVEAPYLPKKQNQQGWAMTLEGSRSSTGAAAMWMCAKTVGLHRQGYGRILEKGLIAKDLMKKKLKKIKSIHILEPTDTNVICFFVADHGDSLSLSYKKTKKIHQYFLKSPYFSVSKTILNYHDYGKLMTYATQKVQVKIDIDNLFLIRLVLMNPFIVSNNTQVNYVDSFVQDLKVALQGL